MLKDTSFLLRVKSLQVLATLILEVLVRQLLIKWAYARAHKQQSIKDATNMVVIMLGTERE